MYAKYDADAEIQFKLVIILGHKDMNFKILGSLIFSVKVVCAKQYFLSYPLNKSCDLKKKPQCEKKHCAQK